MMVLAKWKIAAAVLLLGSLLAPGIGLLTSRLSAGPKPLAFKDDVSRLPADAAKQYAYLKLGTQDIKWKQIPWVLDLAEGLRLAKEEKRPLLLWVSGDDPLERC